MATERTQAVRTAPEPPIDFATATEECPWCGTEISRTKFLEIETRIRSQEQKKLEVVMQTQLQKEILKIKEDAKKESDKQVHAAVQLKNKAIQDRDQALQQIKEKEALIRKQVQEQADQKLNLELAKMRTTIEADRDQTVIKLETKFSRERDDWATKMKQLQLRLQQQRANELGDGAEIDVYDALRDTFPADKITRIKKGEPGADIRHEVLHKGDVCGTILYDSKNRQAWQNAFAQKLRTDQVAAKAHHAILTTTVFPSGKKELCIVDGVIAVNPARVAALVELLRTWMVRMHVLGLSAQKRQDKTAKLYEFVTSETFNKQSQEVGKLTGELLGIDVDEKKQHDKTWGKRGGLLTRLQRVHSDIETQVAAILEGVNG